MSRKTTAIGLLTAIIVIIALILAITSGTIGQVPPPATVTVIVPPQLGNYTVTVTKGNYSSYSNLNNLSSYTNTETGLNTLTTETTTIGSVVYAGNTSTITRDETVTIGGVAVHYWVTVVLEVYISRQTVSSDTTTYVTDIAYTTLTQQVITIVNSTTTTFTTYVSSTTSSG